MSNQEYDVAVSFAGEDREYVDRVANALHELGIKVFYDKFEEVNLWGKDLYTYLDDIYQNKVEYCVMFLSKHYKEKLWTNHERESAQARAFRENREYILPVRFDDTEIPGVRLTTGYLSIEKLEPEELAYKIAKKLNKNIDIDLLIEKLKYYLSDYEIYTKGTNLVFECAIEDYYGEYPVRLLLEMEKLDMLEHMFITPAIVPY